MMNNVTRYNEARIDEILQAKEQLEKPEFLTGQDLHNLNVFSEKQGELRHLFMMVSEKQYDISIDRANTIQKSIRLGGYGFERVWVWILSTFSGCFSCARKKLVLKVEQFAYNFFQKLGPKLDEVFDREEHLQNRLEVEQKFRNSQRNRPKADLAREFAMMREVAKEMPLEKIGTNSFWKEVDSRLGDQEDRSHAHVKHWLNLTSNQDLKKGHATLDRKTASILRNLYSQGIFSPKDTRFPGALEAAGL